MLETKCVDNASCIIGEPCDAEWPSVIGRAPDPAMIEKDELTRRCKSIDE